MSARSLVRSCKRGIKTRDQKCFRWLAWGNIMTPQRTMQPSIARASKWLGPRFAASRHITTLISHTIGFHSVARNLLFISHPSESRILGWSEYVSNLSEAIKMAAILAVQLSTVVYTWTNWRHCSPHFTVHHRSYQSLSTLINWFHVVYLQHHVTYPHRLVWTGERSETSNLTCNMSFRR